MSIPAFLPGAPLPAARSPANSKIYMCDKPKPDKPQRSKPLKTVRSTATWANIFLPQFGRKGPGSDPEWDLRPASQRAEDEGRGICDNCKGTGTMKCHFCSGLDFVAEGGEKVACPACSGQKDVTCSVCYGSKKQVELTGNWWEKGLAALFKE